MSSGERSHRLEHGAPRSIDHVGEGEGVEVMAHVFAYLRPHAQQHALTFVVASTVLVRLPEVACRDRPVDGADDLTERDVTRRAGQHVTAADASLGANETGALQGEQDLLEIRLWQSRPLGDVPHRGRSRFTGAQRE